MGACESLRGLALLILLAGSPSWGVPPRAGARIPNVDLRIAARKKDAGRVSAPLYLFNLHCGAGECTFEEMSLNDCKATPSGTRAFAPAYHRWATWAGSLRVRAISPAFFRRTRSRPGTD